jgi:hypothetical protein
MASRYLYRQWCKKCKNWTLHEKKLMKEELICEECGTVYSDITLGEIPREKIVEQRERYKEKNKRDMDRIFSGYMFGGFDMMSMFEEPGRNVEIQESDAGQRRIDEAEKAERERRREERRQILENNRREVAKYKRVGRNDICICGSGKKYKKCCLERIRNLDV